MEIDRVLLAAKTSEYEAQFPIYESYAGFLTTVLNRAWQRMMPYAIVEARAKGIASFAGKIVRKQDKYHADPTYDVTDRCGARVVTQTAAEKELVCEYIRKHFLIDQANSLDVRERLKEDQFGYLSVHYVIQIPDGVSEMEGQPVPARLKTGQDGFKAEIQVRTLLEHAWANPLHDRLYKVAIQVPTALRREAAGLAALLETGDVQLGALATNIDSYLGHYSAYLAPERLAEEIAVTQAALEYEKKQSKAACLRLDLGRLFWSAGQTDQAIIQWQEAQKSDSPCLKTARMELGHALCQRRRSNPRHAEYRKGMRHLLEVAEAPAAEGEVDSPQDRLTRAEAAHRLAWAYGNQPGKEADARDWYRKALDLDSGNPYHLADYLAYEVFCTRNPELLLPMRDYVIQAIAACRRHIEVGIEQPRAQYTIARLHLLLGDLHAALDAYLQAIHIMLARGSGCPAERLDDEMGFLSAMNFGKPLPFEHECVRRLLVLAKAVKLRQDGRACPELAALRSQASKKLKQPRTALIVAGWAGRMPKDRAAASAYGNVLGWAMKHADGLVCSGGTKAGIPGLVGKAAEKLAASTVTRITLIGYVPRRFPADGPPYASAYRPLITTEGETFSVLEPIQNWIDLLALGLEPGQVRLLGFGGGGIAHFEYRLGLALGAAVGIVPDSGGSADAILRDTNWRTAGNLLRLPLNVLDEATVRAFVRPGTFKIDAEKLDELAALVHEKYLDNTRYSGVDPVRRKFPELREDLKLSNRQQVLYAAEILASEGYELAFVGDPARIRQPEFEPRETERMAALEHGRWNIERLAAGWKYGPKKDVAAKTSPYIKPWDDLPDGEDGVKKYDRIAVNDYAEELRKAGYQIVKTKRVRAD